MIVAREQEMECECPDCGGTMQIVTREVGNIWNEHDTRVAYSLSWVCDSCEHEKDITD